MLWLIILFLGIVLCGAGYYYMNNTQAKKKIVAFYNMSNTDFTPSTSNTMVLILSELIKINLTVTSTPALPQSATVVNRIGTPLISITGLTTNTLYTFSISGYDMSNAVYTGLPTPTPAPGPLFTVTGGYSTTMTYANVPNVTSYQFLILPIQDNLVPNPYTYKVSSQTSNSVTFTGITPYNYICFVQATSATGSTDILSKLISIPYIINNTIVAVTDVNNYSKVNLYFRKDLNKTYTISSVTSTPTLPGGTTLDSPNIGLVLTNLTANQLYSFSVDGVGPSNLLYTGQGSLSALNATPVITKLDSTSLTASLQGGIDLNTTYIFIMYNTSVGFLYSAINQVENNRYSFGNLPYGTYTVTIQVSNQTGTKVGVSSTITIPQP